MKRKYMRREAKKIRAERHQLKTKYGNLYKEAMEILFRHDPIGINFDFNADEYEPEVETILPRLKEATSQRELRKIIHEEFVQWFSPLDVGSESRYENIASEIWAAWIRHQKT
jgi:hypothetical protein